MNQMRTTENKAKKRKNQELLKTGHGFTFFEMKGSFMNTRKFSLNLGI